MEDDVILGNFGLSCSLDCTAIPRKRSILKNTLGFSFLVSVIATLLASSALGFYYPPGHVPPGPPPNYNQIDTTHFKGTPAIPLPPPDSGGVYIYWDQGKWTIANHIYSAGNSLEQFHGSILAQMEQPPQLNVNVFIDQFEFWGDTTASLCLVQNDRWGWVQWGPDLYEIWWDVTTKEWKKEIGDPNDFLKVCIVGCALDFNVWSSAHRSAFTAEQVYLGQTMKRLSSVTGYYDTLGVFHNSIFVDTYSGASDPYQSQAGSDPVNDPNITIFTPKAMSGASFNKFGLITLSDSYPCDPAYGQRYAGSFAYQGNGIQLSTICQEPTNQPPVVVVPDDASFFALCDSICFEVIGSDADAGDSVTLCLLQGPISFSCVKKATIVTDTICFTPSASGTYRFIWRVQDRLGATDVDTVDFTVTLNSPPVAPPVGNSTLFLCNLSQICVNFSCTDPDGNLASSTVNGQPLIGGQFCFTPVAGNNPLTFICVDSCGAADTVQTNVNVILNAPPVATCPGNSSMFVCNLNQICISGFTATDPNNNIATKVVTGGTLTGSTVCFVPVAGLNRIIFTVTDACGAVDACTTVVNVTLNSPPVATCPGNQTMAVCNLNQICIPGFTATDPNNNIATKVVTRGTLTGSTVCFTPVVGLNRIILTVTDSCGAVDACTTDVNVTLNAPPVATCPGSSTMYVCNLNPICLSGFSATDPNNNLQSLTINNQPFTSGQYCFTPVPGNNLLTLICVDACGAADTCATTIFVVLNAPPVATCPGNQTLAVCNLNQICVNGFGATDSDNNLQSCTINGQPYTSGPFCFTPVPGNNLLTLICIDACGAADTCATTINVALNAPPVATCPGNSNLFVCNLNQICVNGFTATDPDNNIATKVVTGGTLNGSTVCFTPAAGMNRIILTVTDACGAVDACTTDVNVSLNAPPVATCPGNQTLAVCDLNQICVNGFSATDPNNNLQSCTINGQPYTSGPFCFTPVFGDNLLTFICIDSCGKADTCTSTVNVVKGPCPEGCPNIVIEKSHNTIQGQYESIAITMDSMSYGIGGFDLLIAYDPSALSLSQVLPGSFVTGCGWEYFNFRNGASGNCGSNACPSGKVRITALAETNNGPNHPDCFQMEPAQLADLVFLVTNDRTFECQYVPIRFCWYDCGDNTVSSVGGDTLYISDQVFDYFDGMNWTDMADLAAAFPSWYGANATCDIQPGDGKPGPVRCINFYNGGIDLVCADSIDDRGDINMNGIPNEVADAVLLGNYFVYGIGVFTVNPAGQIAATDINADGTVLSVADLVYLIRVVVGDAQQYNKITVPVNVSYTHSTEGRLSVDKNIPIGAAVVLVQGQVAPVLLAEQMELKYNFDGTNTRILVWSINGSSFAGDFLQVNGPISSIEMATAEGNPVALNVLPTEFALLQNYPNPFNPKTVISFTLPGASDYKLNIYNVNGQEVASFQGRAENAGSYEIEWEAGDLASGVYLYKLVAGRYTDIKKMILLK